MGQEVDLQREICRRFNSPRHAEIDTKRLNELQAIIPALVFPNRFRPVRPCHSLTANPLSGILWSRVNAAVFDSRYGAILHKASPRCWKGIGGVAFVVAVSLRAPQTKSNVTNTSLNHPAIGDVKMMDVKL
jgi:hypothetical protein